MSTPEIVYPDFKAWALALDTTADIAMALTQAFNQGVALGKREQYTTKCSNSTATYA